MGSHIIDILRQGIWASLTGGWFYDPHQSIFSNTFHLYLWMALLVLPFILHLTLQPSLIVWTLYCGAVGVLFIIVKLINFKLHHMFDTSEVIEEFVEKGDKSDNSDKGSKIIEIGSNENEVEHIEMVPIQHASTSNQSTQVNSAGDEENNNRQLNTTRGLQRKGCLILKDRRPEISGPAPLAECEVDGIDHSPEATDKSKDTEKGSTPSLKGAEGGVDESVENKSTKCTKSNQITTTAEVAINHQVSDGEVEPGEVKKCPRMREDTDSDISPEGGPKIRKRRKAVRRTKSALETSCELYSRKMKHSSEDLHSSLPTRLFTQEESENENDIPEKGRGNSREKKKIHKEKKEVKDVLDEMQLVELEGLNDGRTSPFKQRVPTPHCKKKQFVTMETEKGKDRPLRYGRSVSVDERMVPFRSRMQTPDLQSMKRMKKASSERRAATYISEDVIFTEDKGLSNHPDLLSDLPESADTTPRTPKSISDICHVNVETKDVRKCQDSKTRIRPNSVGDIDSVPSSYDSKNTMVTSKNGKTKDSHLSSRIVKFLKNGGSSDQQDVPSQSSTVGLDWLFSTDSDSSDDGDSHHLESYISESSSTGTNEGDSTFDTNPEIPSPLPYDALEEGEIRLNQDEDLEKMRQQGAIPKHYNRSLKGHEPSPIPSLKGHEPSPTPEETEAGSPSSGEMIDPEDFRKTILEILSDSSANPEQMKKLFKAVFETKGRRGSNREQPSPEISRQKDSKSTGESSTIKDEEVEIRGAESKSVTPTENSALLPSPDTATPGASGVRLRKLGRKRQRGRKSNTKAKKTKEKHIATSYSDTSEGAVHWFQDESGQWFSYTFGNELGVAEDAEGPKQAHSESLRSSTSPSSSSDSVSTVILEDNATEKSFDELQTDFFPRRIDIPGVVRPRDFAELLDRGRQRLTTCDSSSDSDNFHVSSIIEEKPKHFYKFQFLPKKFLKIRFDRLALLALLDRNLSYVENLIAVIIAVLVGALGALVLSSNFYHDIFVFLFCFIIAGCQYSLLKSVQPDAASPMHGYNRMVVFSRPFYFCICCGLMLLLDYCQNHVPSSSMVYGTSVTVLSSLQFGRDLLKVLILCFPILFTIGLLPQVNTFLMYSFEQIDMHIFGGNASVSLTASVYCVIRSLIATSLLYAFCFVAVEVGGSEKACEDKDLAQNAVFSVFSAILVAVSYHLSRSASDPGTLWMLVKDLLCSSQEENQDEGELIDPLPGKLKKCVSERLQSDLLVSFVVMIIVFSVHISTVFSSPVLQPVLSDILYYIAGSIGFLIHYVVPMLRKEMPWLCCSHPIFANRERNFFEATVTPKIMWFEKLYVWFCFFERNIMYPVVFLCALTRSTPHIICSLGKFVGPLVLVVCAMKLIRSSFSNTAKQYLVISFTVFFFKYDYRKAPDTFLIYFFIISIAMTKFCDLMLKMKFIITYIAPWQITWGSAFHAFAQPFSVPHSAMLFVQAGVSALFSTPLNPFLGSAIFFTSYVRPIKFWEKDYNTKRVDHSNTRLSSQLDRNPGADDNNLNSIFYEHLTRSLQHSLCGDLMLGRWGNAEQGDCFIMASDYLNALVHVIEMGNGLITFQLRGLEFRGTYCQQREVEAITEGVEDNEGFCCCEPGHLPHFLSVNAAFNQRWLAWEVVVTKYVLEGYSISENSAATMVHGFDTRKVLLNYYIMSIIYYTVRSPHLEAWLQVESITEHLQSTLAENFVDVDPVFTMPTDWDYDVKLKGVSRTAFCNIYLEWIQYCSNRRQLGTGSEKSSSLVSLCYCLSLLGRRALGTATYNNAATCGDFFLYGLHALFKGDFRITSPHDEWVFADMELLRRVVAPGIRMALKLHQDYYLFTDEYEDHETLYNAISNYEQSMVISHEADPQWRNAVLSNTPSLLALRHVFDVEGSDEYKIIMLNKKFLTFRVVKVNRECVRGLWAGQQQELIYLRNRNPERGSIQNAKQALRNMINSSCDQPIGYPIYVSPLTTSYSSTHVELGSIMGGEFILANVKSFFQNLWVNVRRKCGATCAGSSSGFEESIPYSISCTQTGAASALGHTRSTLSTPTNQQEIALQTLGNRGSLVSTASSAGKPHTLVSFAGFISETTSNKETLSQRVRIVDVNLVYDNINLGRRIDVQWPNEEWRQNGGKSGWHGWTPMKGMEGSVVHKWIPCHRETIKRSHVDKVILLVNIGEKYVPVAEHGVLDLGAEV